MASSKEPKFKTNYPILREGQHDLRPEERHNKRMHKDFARAWTYKTNALKPYGRGMMYTHWWGIPTESEKYMHRYAHRWNLQPLLPLFLAGIWVGCMAHYVNHKINWKEKYWIRELGCDYPITYRPWLSAQLHYHRIASFHFQLYKFFFFAEEQMVDPLNKNSLGAAQFKIYELKRLIREVRYEKERDTSFDFMQFGEDDINDYDDFV